MRAAIRAAYTYSYSLEVILHHEESNGKVQIGAVALVLAGHVFTAAVVAELVLREINSACGLVASPRTHLCSIRSSIHERGRFCAPRDPDKSDYCYSKHCRSALHCSF